MNSPTSGQATGEKFGASDPRYPHSARAAPLSDRINSEPAILRGLTSTEIIVCAAIFFPAWLIVGLLLGLVFQLMQIALVLPIGGTLASIWLASGMMARVKRNRPEHYYWHALLWHLHKRFGFEAPFISHQGHWSLGRDVPPTPRSIGRASTRRHVSSKDTVE